MLLTAFAATGSRWSGLCQTPSGLSEKLLVGGNCEASLHFCLLQAEGLRFTNLTAGSSLKFSTASASGGFFSFKFWREIQTRKGSNFILNIFSLLASDLCT